MASFPHAFILASFLACHAVGEVQEGSLGHGVLAVADAVRHVNGQSRRLQALMGEAMKPLVRQLALSHPERRLASAQCDWSDSTCTYNTAFLRQLINSSSNSGLSAVWQTHENCRAHIDKSACESSSGCTWETDMCGLYLEYEEMETLMEASLLDGCGPLTKDLACREQGASQCSAADGCQADMTHKLSGSTCVEQSSCQGDPFALWCGRDWDLVAARSRCSGVSSSYFDCLYADCPAVQPFASAVDACPLLTSKAACTQNSACSWKMAALECEALQSLLLPQGCKHKPGMDAEAKCGAFAQSQCAGGCVWQEWQDCDSDGNLLTKTECRLGEFGLIKVMAEEGSKDLTVLYNSYLVEQTCAAQTSQTACEGTAAELMSSAEEDASSAPRGAGPMMPPVTAAPAAALAVAALAGLASGAA